MIEGRLGGATFPSGGSWAPTVDLRWYRPPGGDDFDKVLQQKWIRIDIGGASAVQWRDIPTEFAD